MSSEENPKPVAPAEALPHTPAVALDSITNKEPGIMDMAKDVMGKVQAAAKPYTDAAKPYTDAALAQGQKLVDKIDQAAGYDPHTTATTGSTATPATTGPSAPHADAGAHVSTEIAGMGASAQAAGVPATTAEAGEKVKGMFAQVSSSVQSTFNQIGHTIEEKTKTADHPGLLSQMQNFAATATEKVDKFLEGDATTTTGAHPVQTTTNTVPHSDPVTQPPTTS